MKMKQEDDSMPQISLKISHNIDPTPINFTELFEAIYAELAKIPNLDIKTCHGGIIQEIFSYIGFANQKATKVFLEILWLEDPQRALLKKDLAKKLMTVLEKNLVPQIEAQHLICIPRVRIGNLGVLDQDYHISA
jgi:hypothetical protein